MARMTQLERRAATRGKLRTAARVAFARQGYGAVSIDGLTEAAGYSRGAFYANYASKQELLLELLAEVHESEIRAWEQLASEADDADGMFAAMEVRFNEFSRRKDWWLLQGELQLHAQRDAEFGAKYQQYSQEVMGKVEAMLATCAGRIAGGLVLDTRLAALALRALSLGIMFETTQHSDPGKVLVIVMRGLLSDAIEATGA